MLILGKMNEKTKRNKRYENNTVSMSKYLVAIRAVKCFNKTDIYAMNILLFFFSLMNSTPTL